MWCRAGPSPFSCAVLLILESLKQVYIYDTSSLLALAPDRILFFCRRRDDEDQRAVVDGCYDMYRFTHMKLRSR